MFYFKGRRSLWKIQKGQRFPEKASVIKNSNLQQKKAGKELSQRYIQLGLSSSSGAACHTLLQIRTNHFAFTKHPEVKGGIKSANFASH